MSTREEKILALLKRSDSMMYKDIKSYLKLTRVQMNKASLSLRRKNMVVSVNQDKTRRWYDKDYARRKGIKPDDIVVVKGGALSIGEQPYIERMILINRYWRIA